MAFWAPILAAIAGSTVTGLFNSSQANKNRDFQQYNSDTAHQREVADLRAAGINPILSAKLGGASTPGGSTATMPDLGQTLSSAYMNQQTVKNMKEENKNLIATREKILAEANQATTVSARNVMETEYLRMQYAKADAEIKLLGENIISERLNNAASAASLPQVTARARTEAKIEQSGYGQVLRYLSRMNPFANSAGAIGLRFQPHR